MVRMADLPESKRAVMAFQHEKAVTTSKISTTTSRRQERERDETPALLATHAKLSRDKPNLTRLRFATTAGKAVTVTLNQRLLHSLFHMLVQTTEKARWGLRLRLGGIPVASEGDAPAIH